MAEYWLSSFFLVFMDRDEAEVLKNAKKKKKKKSEANKGFFDK